MMGWRRYRHRINGEVVNGYRVERARKVAGTHGSEADEARAGDYVFTNSRGKLWVEPGWLVEEMYERVNEGAKDGR
jgi:hypothetical protein